MHGIIFSQKPKRGIKKTKIKGYLYTFMNNRLREVLGVFYTEIRTNDKQLVKYTKDEQLNKIEEIFGEDQITSFNESFPNFNSDINKNNIESLNERSTETMNEIFTDEVMNKISENPTQFIIPNDLVKSFEKLITTVDKDTITGEIPKIKYLGRLGEITINDLIEKFWNLDYTLITDNATLSVYPLKVLSGGFLFKSVIRLYEKINFPN